jgi:hypothetical protein
MFVHDLSPKGSFRKLLSYFIEQTFNYWQFILLFGGLGFTLSVISFIDSRKYLHLVTGVIALLVSGFFYYIMYAISRSGI